MKSNLLTESDGRRLAVELLLEMSQLGLDELAIDGSVDAAEVREGRPQSDVLARYLRSARQNNALEAGFIAVLTDVLGSAAEGRSGESLAHFYEGES